MAVGRQDHEMLSATLAMPIIWALGQGLSPDANKRIVVRSLALGNRRTRANRKIHSIKQDDFGSRWLRQWKRAGPHPGGNGYRMRMGDIHSGPPIDKREFRLVRSCCPLIPCRDVSDVDTRLNPHSKLIPSCKPLCQLSLVCDRRRNIICEHGLIRETMIAVLGKL